MWNLLTDQLHTNNGGNASSATLLDARRTFDAGDDWARADERAENLGKAICHESGDKARILPFVIDKVSKLKI